LSDAIQEVIETLSELKRMHQLNYELMEQLNITCQWIVDSNIKIPNADCLCSLLGKSLALIAEVQADSPKTLVYQKLSDKWKRLPESDGKVPVPIYALYKGGIVFSEQQITSQQSTAETHKPLLTAAKKTQFTRKAPSAQISYLLLTMNRTLNRTRLRLV
jgi:hypothetical protein